MIHALRIGRKKHDDGYVYLLHIAPHAKLWAPFVAMPMVSSVRFAGGNQGVAALFPAFRLRRSRSFLLWWQNFCRRHTGLKKSKKSVTIYRELCHQNNAQKS